MKQPFVFGAIFFSIAAAATILIWFNRQPPQDSIGEGVQAPRKTCAVRTGPLPERVVIDKAADAPQHERRCVVYFFFLGGQCPCSEEIEAGACETLTAHFAEHLKSGKIEWQKVDAQEDEHAHFIQDYKLAPLDHLHDGLVIVEVTNEQRGRWKKLIEADALKENPAAYTAYVKQELEAFMQEP